LVYAVTRWISEAGGNILDSQQFTDTSDDEFFLRVHFDFPDDRTVDGLSQSFAAVAASNQMTFRLVVAETPMRTLVMVSKEGHCLNDLLYRQSTGGLNIEIPAIVSNHRDLERLAAAYDVPFHHVPVADKPAAEARMLAMIDELDIDLVVLARYMQILSDDVCSRLEGRAINIHHSFLPSFKGARPYQQAHDRGVKLIGATAHYVTATLDEGPIIEQEVLRVDHRMTAADLARVGRDVESQTLSRAVQLHAESRVLMNGPRTVVFA
jgi:formyltetrahydrofolate deformylase